MDRDVTPAELARAYRTLARRHHPDRNGNDAEQATKRMVALNEAFAILSDPVRRFDYNRSLDRSPRRTSQAGRPEPDSPFTGESPAREASSSPDDPVRRARRESKERAAAEAKRRGYRDPNAGRMDFRAPD